MFRVDDFYERVKAMFWRELHVPPWDFDQMVAEEKLTFPHVIEQLKLCRVNLTTMFYDEYLFAEYKAKQRETAKIQRSNEQFLSLLNMQPATEQDRMKLQQLKERLTAMN